MISPTIQSRPEQPSEAAVGAFFDVDNTLIPGAAIELHFFRYLWREGIIGIREGAASAWHLLRHMPPLSVHPLRERKLYLAAKLAEPIERLAADFVRRTICPRLSADALAAIERHRKAGHHLVLLTGSLDFLIAPLAAHLDVSSVLAARPERADGRFTGHVLAPLPYGEGKRRLVEELTTREGIQLAGSYAYGDSPGDFAVLRAVGNPLVVNPIRGMRRIARQQGWPIARWA
jgi:HAD superfamily hydrolase (TIGR01490 family)